MRMVRAIMVIAVVMFTGALAAVMASQDQPPAGGRSGRGWEIPAGAAQEPNPVTASPEVLAKGKKLFTDNCQKCHGASGKGDGPDADPDEAPEDLTDSSRAARNPDGVMYYKVWNGRKSPKMPGMKTEGWSKEDVWTVVHYTKSLRK
jgi:mono/diheme cytochrome c family protein